MRRLLPAAAHAELVRLGFAHTLRRQDRTAYLTVSGWTPIGSGYWWQPPVGVEREVEYAVELQQMRDAVSYLESRSWVVVDAWGKPGSWSDVKKIRDPVAQRDYSWRSATMRQLAREDGGHEVRTPSVDRPKRHSPSDDDRWESLMAQRWCIDAPRVRLSGDPPPSHPRSDASRLQPFLPGMPAALVWVTARSAATYRRAVEQCAMYFQREFHFDFVQYARDDHGSDSEAFLWVNRGDASTVVGACLFVDRAGAGLPSQQSEWGLSWVWFHPFARRCGNLSRAWGFFEQVFVGFRPEPPLSSAMEAFLARRRASLPTG